MEPSDRHDEDIRRALLAMSDPVLVLSWPGLAVLAASDGFCALTGLRRGDFLGRDFGGLSCWNDPDGAAFFRRTLEEKKAVESLAAVFRQHPGGQVSVLVTARITAEKGGELAIVAVRDIDRYMQAEIELRESEEKYRRIFNNIQDVYFEASLGGVIVEMTPSVVELCGLGRGEVIGRSLTDVVLGLDQFLELKRQLQERPNLRDGELAVRTKDGQERFCSVHARLVTGGDGAPVKIVGSLRDITQRKKAHQEIRQLAYYDSLTGLANRMLLYDRVDFALRQAQREKRSVGLFFLDLDRFKQVNDTLGHDIGDLLLKEVAARLLRSVRRNDTVARLGGDEFVVLLNGVRNAQETSMVVRKVLEEFALPCRLGGHELRIATSIGIALSPGDGEDSQSLFKHADMALYAAKEQGRGGYQFFSESMNQKTRQRFEQELDLRRGLAAGEFFLVYQPQMATGDAGLIGVEALVRWRHPARGLLSPAAFLPVAEETGIVCELGRFVLAAACVQVGRWQKAGLPIARLGVNVSGRELRERDFTDAVARALAADGLVPGSLELELTEAVLMEDPPQVAAILGSLKEMGVSIAIDNFGTGYLSLGFLKRFPIDRIKIDQGFVQSISSDTKDAAIVEAIIAMAATLGFKAAADGVENTAQFCFLKDKNCPEAQGYYFERPLEPAAFESWLAGLNANGPEGE